MQMRELPKHERAQWARRPLVLAAPKGTSALPPPRSASHAQPRADVGRAIAGLPIAGP
jgi:hypothetical protein